MGFMQEICIFRCYDCFSVLFVETSRNMHAQNADF